MAYSEKIKTGKLTECSEDELRNALITLDGLGQKVKVDVLEELLERARSRGWEQCFTTTKALQEELQKDAQKMP